jgi:hypothetical protein
LTKRKWGNRIDVEPHLNEVFELIKILSAIIDKLS